MPRSGTLFEPKRLEIAKMSKDTTRDKRPEELKLDTEARMRVLANLIIDRILSEAKDGDLQSVFNKYTMVKDS